MSVDPDELLAPKEVRRMLKISERTFRRWDADGVLPEPYLEIKGARRWKRADVDFWIRQKAEEKKAARLNAAKCGQGVPKGAKPEAATKRD